MAITTQSAFNYGHKITNDNQYINFSEDGIEELTAIVTVGSYTLEAFKDAVSTAINAKGGQLYTVTLDRATRKLTISAPGTFELWIDSGAQTNVSTYSLMGFSGADLTGLITYESNGPSGFQYLPQFLLQGFVDFEDEQRKATASVNESASGLVQVASYGDVKLMSCNITLASNIIPQVAITENATGVDDLRDFMVYSSNKNSLEFIPDVVNPSTGIISCLLEKTPEDKKGTGFKLKELYSRNLTGYFETGTLQFRKLN